jgi:hypothetical protein
MTVVPYYWDLVSRLDYKQSDKSRMFWTLFTSTDSMEFISQDSRGNRSTSVAGAQDQLALDMAFTKFIYGWDMDISDNMKNELRASVDKVRQRVGAWMDFTDYSLYLRDELNWKVLPHLTLKTGIDGFGDSPNHTLNFFLRADSASSRKVADYVHGGAYANADYSPIKSLILTPGLRYDYYSDLNEGDPSVRLTARWNFRKGHTAKAALGTYNQMPQPFQATDPRVGNPSLPTTLGKQAVAGYEWDITDLINLDAQAYYNTQDRIPRVTDLRAGGKFVNYLSDEKGRMYGLEIMLRHQPSKHFFGWISYTLSKSERQSPQVPPDPPFGGLGDIIPFQVDGFNSNFRGIWDPWTWFVFDKDQTHNLQVVASWKLPRNWEFGTRVRYVTGNPITPQLGYTQNKFEFDAGSTRYVDIVGAPRSDRMGPFFQVDARMDKKWIKNSWLFSLYLDVQNVNYFWYNSPELYDYNFDNSKRQAIGGIILPTVGVEAEF